jgi:hypothetical protein
MSTWPESGCITYEPTPQSLLWAQTVERAAHKIAQDPKQRQKHLRHGGTWFVGVDALPNGPSGEIDGVQLEGPWQADLPVSLPLHRAQLSIIFPRYPQRDPSQSKANHQFRIKRYAAHVDGILPQGTPPRRYAREFHAYILVIHINECSAAPTVFWSGSQRVLQTALTAALKGGDGMDITDAYQAARAQCLEQITPVELTGPPGGAFLMHPFLLHGTAPWPATSDHQSPRITAFFRPQYERLSDWLHAP